MRWRRNSRANAGIPTSRPGNDERSQSVGVDAEAQGFRSDKGHQIAAPPPGRDLAERCGNFVVGLRLCRRTVAALQLARNEDDGVSRDRKLTHTRLAP